MDLWFIVDWLGALAGPLWPDWLDAVLDAITSVPDMWDECGLCAIDNVWYALLFAIGQQDCNSVPSQILATLTGLCE